MLAKEFITEKKRKTKKKKTLRKYFFPGFAYYGISGDSSASGGDGGGGESLAESPEIELARKLPSLKKHDYNTIDLLMKKIAKKHSITGKALHNKFVKKFRKIPDDWIKEKISETQVDDEIRSEVDRFADWACKILKIKEKPKITLSMDTEEAQQHHHTGKHIHGDDKIWVYAKNRNLVDILRTVIHELTHVRQGELDMIKPGSSYPGSPIEAQADMVAGKFIKIWGAKNPHIFQ